ncbi:MAG TPA: holo-ACP synthase [Leptospiraceae bacterium]|nr:holo-ACP synthase [Leptospiraceae bacterium]
MKLSVGNDLVENIRIRELYEKYGKKFLAKVFTEQEAEYCTSKKDPVPYLSARFACKEAFIKAIDLPKNMFPDMTEIELCGTEFGKKEMKLHGKVKELFDKSEYSAWTVSITHTENYAEAVVILYG